MIARLLAPFALLSAAVAIAQSGETPPTPQPMAQPMPRPMQFELLHNKGAVPAADVHPALWKVADADTTIYVFGTVHLLPPGMEWFKGNVAAAFAESHELVTEIPEIGASESQAVLLRRGILPAGQRLRDQLTPRQKAKFEAALAKFGVPAAGFDRFKPWYAAVVLSTLPLQKSGFSLASGVEASLAARAKDAGKPRTGLETLDYQLSLFEGFSPEIQRKYLFSVVDALPKLEGEVARMVEAWQRGDAGTLADLMNAEQEDPAMVAALLTNRNKTWAGWMKRRLDRPGTVFVAVGAGHLGGKGSVQDQLAALGLNAARVQ